MVLPILAFSGAGGLPFPHGALTFSDDGNDPAGAGEPTTEQETVPCAIPKKRMGVATECYGA